MKPFNPSDLPVLTGTKVRLRPITDNDTHLIVTWRNSPSVKQNFIFRGEMTPQIHENWMRTKVMTGNVVQYIIEELPSGRAIGSVYYRDIEPQHNSAEFGIFIGEPEARGQGFGSETAKLFVDFGFRFLGLHRISLRVLGGNDQAIRSYEKAGFRLEGVFRDMVLLDGKYRDVIFMSILSDDPHTSAKA